VYAAVTDFAASLAYEARNLQLSYRALESVKRPCFVKCAATAAATSCP
jgi:hypothetical protein